MEGFAKTAAALLLLCGGGVLMYRGAQQYFGAVKSQRDAAAEWRDSGRKAPKLPAAAEPVLAEGTPFSKLNVPRLNKTFYVVEGSNAAALEKGPGHVRGSAMPGQDGNCVIAGHRDLHFRFLKDLKAGDSIQLEDSQGEFTYKVVDTAIISPSQTEVLQPTRTAQLHLITCYPFFFIGHAPKRFVVTAELETQPAAVPLPQPLPHRSVVKRRPLTETNYEKSLEATRELNRRASL